MGKITVKDNIMQFVRNNADAMDNALGRMAIDIERLSKMQVPAKEGHLRDSGTHKRIGKLNYIVEYNKEYARFQEFGGDSKRRVKHYSQPGSKAFYLRDSGREIAAKALSYITQEVGTIKI